MAELRTLQQMKEDVMNVSLLPDQPTCTAAELKAYFDEAGREIKHYINTVLVPFVNAMDAVNLAFQSTAEIPAESIQDAIAMMGKLTKFSAGAYGLPAGSAPTVERTDAPDGGYHLSFGIPRGERGADGVSVGIDGFFSLYVDEDSRLKLVCTDADTASCFEIDRDETSETYGHLIYTVSPVEEKEKIYDLGSVIAPGSMMQAVYDPLGKMQDVYSYADGLKVQDYTATLLAAGWADKKITVPCAAFSPDCKYEIGPADTATAEQAAVWDKAYIMMDEKAEGSFVLRAEKNVPEADIPIMIRIYP